METKFIGFWLFEFSYGHREVVPPKEPDTSHGNLHGHTATVSMMVTAVSEAAKAMNKPEEYKAVKVLVQNWVKANWHMRMLMWNQDPVLKRLDAVPGIVSVPFNPSWNEMARVLHTQANKLLEQVGFVATELRLAHGSEGGAVSTLSKQEKQQ